MFLEFPQLVEVYLGEQVSDVAAGLVSVGARVYDVGLESLQRRLLLLALTLRLRLPWSTRGESVHEQGVPSEGASDGESRGESVPEQGAPSEALLEHTWSQFPNKELRLRLS